MDANGHATQHDEPEPTVVLIRRLRGGEADAAGLLNRLYRDALIRFCWGYLGRMDEAEDALQDIWYKVLTARQIPDRFRPWLYKIARNHCLNLLRNRARRREGQGIVGGSQIAEAMTGHLTRLVKEELRSRVSELVRNLPESQQEVLRLRYVEGLARSEVAEVLEVPESVVKSRLFEGLKTLREHSSLMEDL